METLLGYALSLVIACSGSYAMGRSKGSRAGETSFGSRLSAVAAFCNDKVEKALTERVEPLEAASRSLLNGFKELSDEVGGYRKGTQDQLDHLRGQCEKLDGRIAEVLRDQRTAAEQAAASVKAMLDERLAQMVTRDEVQSAFAEVAQKTAAQELARREEVQRQMLRREEVFGRAREPMRPPTGMDINDVNERLRALQEQLAAQGRRESLG